MLGCSLLSPVRLSALTESESAQMQSIIADMLLARQSLALSAQTLTDSRASLQEQGQLLSESKRRVSQLSAQLQLWREHSDELGNSLERLSGELATLRGALRRLTDTYNALSTLHEDSLRASDKAILARERQVKVWRAIGLVAIIAAVIGWLTAALT